MITVCSFTPSRIGIMTSRLTYSNVSVAGSRNDFSHSLAAASASAPGRRRKSVFQYLLHRLDERVDLLKRGVDVRRHAQPRVVEHRARRPASDDSVDDNPIAVHHEP